MSSITMPEKKKKDAGNYRRNQQIGMWIRFAIMCAATLFALFPVVWILAAAINPSQSMANQSLIPEMDRAIRTSINGNVAELFVQNGDYVEREQVVMIIESDDNTFEAKSAFSGTIYDLTLAVGDEAQTTTELMRVQGDARNLLVNFEELLNNERKPFLLWVRNSLVIASVTSILAVFITSLASYAFSRFRFKYRQGLLITILLVQVFPNLLAMVAIFLILQSVGRHIPFLGLDTLGGLILVYLGGQMGINIWLMKGFFDSVPKEIDESAMVDGASHWQVYWQLIFPLVRPILVVVGILTFIGVLNEFVLARVILQNAESWTLMVGLYSYIGDNFANNWGVFAAGALLGSIPTLVIYIALQDQIVGGLTQGSVKG